MRDSGGEDDEIGKNEDQIQSLWSADDDDVEVTKEKRLQDNVDEASLTNVGGSAVK